VDEEATLSAAFGGEDNAYADAASNLEVHLEPRNPLNPETLKALKP
jgi:hypothetical protein